MSEIGQISKFSVQAILEKRGDEITKDAKAPGVGEWSGDQLITSVYSMDEIVNRMLQIRSIKKGPMEKQLKRVLPPLIKKDRHFTAAIIDVMGDPSIKGNEKADLLDNNIDEFFESHKQEIDSAMGSGQKVEK